MASFFEELWTSVLTPGVTPTLVIATHTTFAVLQLLLLALLVASFNIHFLVLSVLSASLWGAIGWFIRELQAIAAEKAQEEGSRRGHRARSPDAGSETETETEAEPASQRGQPESLTQTALSSSLRPVGQESDDMLRKRRSLGDSSGYVSTDSEWEKISEGDDPTR